MEYDLIFFRSPWGIGKETYCSELMKEIIEEYNVPVRFEVTAFNYSIEDYDYGYLGYLMGNYDNFILLTTEGKRKLKNRLPIAHGDISIFGYDKLEQIYVYKCYKTERRYTTVNEYPNLGILLYSGLGVLGNSKMERRKENYLTWLKSLGLIKQKL
jgi:hypothetical protein